MDVLFVTHKYPPMTGGMEKQSYELVSGMGKYARVHSLCYNGKESKTLFFWNLRSRVKRILSHNPHITIVHFNDAVKSKGFSWFLKNVVSKLPDEYLYVMVGPLDFRKGIYAVLYKLLPNLWQRETDLFLGWADDSNNIYNLLKEPFLSPDNYKS